MHVLAAQAVDNFEILPDLPEPMSAAQASSVSTTDNTINLATQTIGQQVNYGSVILSLIIVILLIYASGIIYSRLNKFGLKLMKNEMGELNNHRATVISTTQLGNNKTLHVIELDGKRMLIGASSNSIDLIKDLGSYPSVELEESEFSKIEIPNIRIPKIEIPKIEFPNIGFTKTSKKVELENNEEAVNEDKNIKQNEESNKEHEDEGFVISDIYEENSDGIIDNLFRPKSVSREEVENKKSNIENMGKSTHSIDPDDYALYKKYL